MSTTQTVCLCNKGHITQKHDGDDWNRFEDGPVVIDCEECNRVVRIHSAGAINATE